MRIYKNIQVDIQICDICGITWEQAKRKFPKETQSYAGFGKTLYKIIGWISICPRCKERQNLDIFDNIIALKITLLRQVRRMLKEPKCFFLSRK